MALRSLEDKESLRGLRSGNARTLSTDLTWTEEEEEQSVGRNMPIAMSRQYVLCKQTMLLSQVQYLFKNDSSVKDVIRV